MRIVDERDHLRDRARPVGWRYAMPSVCAGYRTAVDERATAASAGRTLSPDGWFATGDEYLQDRRLLSSPRPHR